MFALTLPKRLPNFCSAIRATLGQRQIRQSPGFALNAHSGNEWGNIPVLTGFLIVGLFQGVVLSYDLKPHYSLQKPKSVGKYEQIPQQNVTPPLPNYFLARIRRGVNPGGWESCDPQVSGRGVVGSQVDCGRS